jgi:hypothetical protein
VALLAAAAGFVFMGLNRADPDGPVFGHWLENAALALAFPTIGVLVVTGRPRNPIGWILVAAGLSGAVVFFSSEYALYAVFTEPGTLPGGEIMAWVSGWAGTIAFGVLFSFLFLLFPDGQLPSARWRPVAWLAGATLTSVLMAAALGPELIDEAGAAVPKGAPRTLRNPFGVEGTGSFFHRVETTAILVFVVCCALPAVVSLFLRYRRATGEQRQQIKWLAYVAVMLALGIFVVPDLLRAVWGRTSAISTVTAALDIAPVPGIAIAVGLAILRHRLYDIDVVINRTLVYGTLTATLAAAYLGSVLVLRLLLSPLTGESDLAVAGSTLAVAALFGPARRRIQSLVDRRFYRARYDAARTLEAFSARLRDEIDLETLGVDLRRVVTDTVQPAHVRLWLRSTP